MQKHVDFWSMFVVVLTLILFVTALFLKGFTHEVLLESGVFMVSVKLILMSYKNTRSAAETGKKLEQMMTLLLQNQKA